MSGPSPLPACGDEIAGYLVLGELSPSRSWLAQAADGRRVVLKALEEDCLLSGELHPSIRQRLARVRELPHKRLASLHGVERVGDRVYLVWDFVEGQALAEAVRGPDASQAARELVLCVAEMHSAGIVHGAIHEGNVFVDRRGEIWLTDVSPLLWTDEQDDARAVVALLKDRVGDDAPAWRAALKRAAQEQWGLVDLLRSVSPPQDLVIDENERRQEQTLRRRSLMWAGLAAAAALALALAVLLYAQ